MHPSPGVQLIGGNRQIRTTVPPLARGVTSVIAGVGEARWRLLGGDPAVGQRLLQVGDARGGAFGSHREPLFGWRHGRSAGSWESIAYQEIASTKND